MKIIFWGCEWPPVLARLSRHGGVSFIMGVINARLQELILLALLFVPKLTLCEKTCRLPFATRLGLEVQFTPEQQAQLAQIATQAGTEPERLVTSVVARYLDEEARFLAAVEKGLAAAGRGEFIEEEEMDARLEAMLKL